MVRIKQYGLQITIILLEEVMEYEINEAVEKFDLPKDICRYKGKFFISQECDTDIFHVNRMLFSIRTKDITEEEISDWTQMNKVLNEIDLEDARKRVKIIRDEDIFCY